MIKDTSGQDSIVDKSGRFKASYIAYAAVFLLGAGLLYGTLRAAPEAVVDRDSLVVASVTRGDLSRSLLSSGRTVAKNSPSIYAKEDGTLTLFANSGSTVSRGQDIALIDSPQLSGDINREQAELERKNTELETMRISLERLDVVNQHRLSQAALKESFALREMERARDAWKRGVVPEVDYLKASDQYAIDKNDHFYLQTILQREKEELAQEVRAKEASIRVQVATLEELRRRQGDLVIKSPITGIVGSMSVESGDFVTRNQKLTSIVNTEQLVVEADVPESFIQFLRHAMPAEVSAGSASADGAIDSISSEVVDGKVTVRIAVNASELALRNNRAVSVRFDVPIKENVLMLKNGPFFDQLGGKHAYVIESRMATRRPAEFGIATRENIEVVSGLKLDDQVIVSDVAQFSTLTQVRIAGTD